MLLMIDNYDSFTYNLVQYFGELGQEVKVVRNDALDVAGIAALAPQLHAVALRQQQQARAVGRQCIAQWTRQPCSKTSGPPVEEAAQVAAAPRQAGEVPGACAHGWPASQPRVV